MTVGMAATASGHTMTQTARAALPLGALLLAAAPLAAARGTLGAVVVFGAVAALPYALLSRRARARDGDRLEEWLRGLQPDKASWLARGQLHCIAASARRRGDHEVLGALAANPALRALARDDRRSAPPQGASPIATVRAATGGAPRRARERRDRGARRSSSSGDDSDPADPDPDPGGRPGPGGRL